MVTKYLEMAKKQKPKRRKEEAKKPEYEYDIHPETFEIKIAGKEDDPIKNVDPKWIGYWLSAVFYKLTKNFQANGLIFLLEIYVKIPHQINYKNSQFKLLINNGTEIFI